MSRAPARQTGTTNVLDNRQVPCALGLLRIRDAMAGLADGALLVVESRDRFAPMEIALWTERAGHELVSVHPCGRWPRRGHRLTLRKTVTRERSTVGPLA